MTRIALAALWLVLGAIAILVLRWQRDRANVAFADLWREDDEGVQPWDAHSVTLASGGGSSIEWRKRPLAEGGKPRTEHERGPFGRGRRGRLGGILPTLLPTGCTLTAWRPPSPSSGSPVAQ
jgi:hypothetical protein